MLDVPPGVSPGQPGANSRPPLAAEATRQLLTGPTDHGPGRSPAAANRCRTAVTSNPTAANASPVADSAGPAGARSIPVASPARVKNTRTSSARAAKRRSQPRTVEPGASTMTATRRHPAPDATLAINAAMITSAEYILLSRHNTGSRTCVTPQPEHLARRGRTQQDPSTVHTCRRRACPHPANRAEHPGQLSRPASNSTSTTDPVPATVNNVVPPRAAARPSHGRTSARTRTAGGPLLNKTSALW